MTSRHAFRRFIVLFTIFWLADTSSVLAQTIEQVVPNLAKTLSEQLVAKKNPKVTALDFTDLQGISSELGQYLAEQLSVDLVMEDGITIVDRAHLDSIMDELKLTYEGLVNPENAKKFGKFTGVDAILFGNLTIIGAEVIVTVKAVSTETSEVVAAGRAKIDLTNNVRRMLGLSVSSSSEGALVGQEFTVPIAAVTVGPINVSVRNVSYGFEGRGKQHLPQIQVTLALENVNPDSFVAISVYSLPTPVRRTKSRLVSVGEIYGALQETTGTKWSLESLSGIPFTYCFDAATDFFAGGAPFVSAVASSSLVDCIKGGLEYRGGDVGQLLSQSRSRARAWHGGFASIEPSGKLEIVTSFVPETSSTQVTGYGRSGSNQTFSWPKSVRLALELIIGTHRNGQFPESAKDFTIKNLVIGRIDLPS